MTVEPNDLGWIPNEPENQAAPAPQPLYSSLDAWVGGHLAPLIRRRLGGSIAWCPWWWKHPDAVSRLNALWQEWEQARLDGTMSTWWLHHADPHLDRLMSKDNGPFMACRFDKHTELDPLPTAASDPQLWLGTAYTNPPWL
jgi:hypothetical protein